MYPIIMVGQDRTQTSNTQLSRKESDMDKKTINAKYKELAELKMMYKEIEDAMDGIKDELKEYMKANNLDELVGDEHKATWKEVESSRFDSTTFKAQYPDLYEAFKKPSTTRRFDFS